MRKRIFSIFALLTAIVTVLSCLTLAWYYYGFYKNYAKREIRRECALILAGYEGDADAFTARLGRMGSALRGGIRLTFVAADGAVLFDSDVSAQSLDNHARRDEIALALANGEGEATRWSDTLQTNVYYFAERLPDGFVLRVAQRVDSAFSVFRDTVPLVVFLLAGLLALTLTAASFLTRALVRPIGDAARVLDDLLVPLADGGEAFPELHTYDELAPFIQKLRALRGQLDEYVGTLHEERDAIRDITGNMREGLILLDRKKDILLINISALNLLGVPNGGDYTGRNILRLTRSRRLRSELDGVLESGCGASFTDTDDGGRCRRFFISPAMSGEELSAGGAMVFIIDVTREMQTEQIRREFAANVSHELKTPLTSINGFAEMLETGMVRTSGEVQACGARIHKESNRLIALIEDITRLSQIENGAQPDEQETFSLMDIAREAAFSVEQSAREKEVSVVCKGEDTAVSGSRAMFYELAFNLADNAVKYNRPGGSVEIRVTAEETGLAITVTDTGIGVPEEHLDRIFERFYRVDKSRSKQTGGTGLGLSIVKHIVEQLHGSIQVQSTVGEGTAMRVTLPAVQPGEAGRKNPPQRYSAGGL